MPPKAVFPENRMRMQILIILIFTGHEIGFTYFTSGYKFFYNTLNKLISLKID